MSIIKKNRKTLSEAFFTSQTNVADCVNGISLNLTSGCKNYEYCEAYQTVEYFVKILSKLLEDEEKPVRLSSKAPSLEDIERSKVLSVFCISENYPNRLDLRINKSKVHLHGFIYGIHKYNKELKEFLRELSLEVKMLPYFRQRSRYSLMVKPVSDPIDDNIRRDSLSQLMMYIENPPPNTWMNYLKNVNSHQLLYAL